MGKVIIYVAQLLGKWGGAVISSRALMAMVSTGLLAIGAGNASAYHLCDVQDARLTTTYLGNHPMEKSPGWHEGLQGFTHGENGDDNWYITHQDTGVINETKNRLWRVPFSHNLADNVYDLVPNPGGSPSFVQQLKPGIGVVDHRDIPELADYDHFGDPDYYDPDNDGAGYVFIPIEGPGVPGAVAVFEVPSLQYLYKRPVQSDGSKHAPWLAFDSAGYLYTSQSESSHPAENVDPKRLNKWTVDWDLLASGPRPGDFRVFDKTGEVALLSYPVVEAVCNGELVFPVTGSGPRTCEETIPVGRLGEALVGVGLKIPQGGDFSDDDQLLYISNGWSNPRWRCHYNGLLDADDPDSVVRVSGCGVHGFEIRSSVVEGAPCSADPGSCFAVRIERSTNNRSPFNEGGPFNYSYLPGSPNNLEEPEGLDWFDLDAPGAPQISGFTDGSCTDPVSGELLDPCPVSGQLHVSLLDVDLPGLGSAVNK